VGFRLARGRKRVVWSAVVVVVVAAGVGGWLVFGPSSAESTGEELTAEVTSGPQRQTVSASGTVEPAQRADLEFAVSGSVTGVHVAEGDRVTAGQVLATVDDELLQAEVDAADSALDAAQARRDDDAAADASDTQLAADDAAVVSARSRLASAQESLDNARLRSTIAGTVVSVDLAAGDQVSGGDDTNPDDNGTTTPNSANQPDDESDDTSGITVVSTDRYVVDAGVSSSDVDKVKKGQQVEITPVDATAQVEGTVRSVGLVAEAADSGAATFPVTVDITGKRDDVYAGSSATVTIVIEERDDVLTVPSAALHSEGDTTYVNKIVDGRTVKTTVEIGTAYGPVTEIVSGLREGDEVEIAAFVRGPGGGGGGDDGGGGGGGPGGQVKVPGGDDEFGGPLPGGK
jgi:multidrug efflux pump subunit AcrA (membrane-fusion protein)